MKSLNTISSAPMIAMQLTPFIQEILAAAFNGLPQAVVILSGNSQILFANYAAGIIFSENDGVSVDALGICASGRLQTAKLRRLIADAACAEKSAASASALLLDRPSSRRPLLVTVAPASIELNAASLPEMTVMLFVVDPERETSVSGELLREIFGLTSAEAAIARAIMAGAGVKTAAKALALAPSTVRTLLQRVFIKTRTHRQSELIRLIQQVESVIQLKRTRRVCATAPDEPVIDSAIQPRQFNCTESRRLPHARLGTDAGQPDFVIQSDDEMLRVAPVELNG